MDFLIYQFFGEGEHLNVLQMCSRAFVIFFVALVLIRISGRRTFGKHTAFDNTMAIILGAVLGRAVVGASPMIPTIACTLLMVLMHRALAWLATKNKMVSRMIKGDKITLFKDGEINQENLQRSLMSEKDLAADMRLKGGAQSLDEVEEMYMEATGEVSVIKKKK